MAPHSSTLAWNIPWKEEPGRLQSMGSLGVRHDWATSLSLFHFHALEKEMATHSSVLAWRIPGTEEPGGLPSLGLHRVGHDWSNLAACMCTLQIYTNSTFLQRVKVKSLSCVQLFVTPWTVAYLPGSSVYGIFQARVLEWVAISFSRESSRPREWTRDSCIAGRCFTIWATREAQG